MRFDEFQNLARLYALDALDPGELRAFELAREALGPPAETYIKQCQALSAAFALSLYPRPPRTDAKARLMSLIRQSCQHTSALPV